MNAAKAFSANVDYRYDKGVKNNSVIILRYFW
jgi:hypothetical protein